MPCSWTPCSTLASITPPCAHAVRPLWLAVVHPSHPAYDRACASCGTLDPQNNKNVCAEMLLDVYEDCRERQGIAIGADRLIEVAVNMCNSALAWHEAEPHGPDPTLCLCQTCNTWLMQRRGQARNLLPLQALQWYFRTTLPLPGLRHIDTRVLYKLACAVAERWFNHTNPFRLCFYPEEQALLDAIAASPPTDIKPLVAAHYLQQNAGSGFMPSAKTAEFLREHLGHTITCDGDCAMSDLE